MVAGYYLAFFFSLSHNFEGVHMQSDTTRPSNKGSKEQSFLYKQVRSIHQKTKQFIQRLRIFIRRIIAHLLGLKKFAAYLPSSQDQAYLVPFRLVARSMALRHCRRSARGGGRPDLLIKGRMPHFDSLNNSTI